MIENSDVKIFERIITSQKVSELDRTSEYRGRDNVIRVAQCKIPDNKHVFEYVQEWLSKYGANSWLADWVTNNKKKASGDWEWECTEYGSYVILIKDEHGEWIYATTYGCVDGHWKYVETADDTGGGGTGGGDDPSPPCLDPTMPCHDGGGSVSGEICKPYQYRDQLGECQDLYQNQPCLGDVIKSPTVTKSNGWNKKGGLHGHTRNSGNTFHDGIDINAPINSDLFSMNCGVVTDIRDDFDPGEFVEESYGNYIEVKSIIDGTAVFIRYNHLNSVSVEIGDPIYAGEKIGKNGNTGNAQSKNNIIVLPHVHIKTQVELSDGTLASANPNQYMATKFNSNGTVNTSESNCN